MQHQTRATVFTLHTTTTITTTMLHIIDIYNRRPEQNILINSYAATNPGYGIYTAYKQSNKDDLRSTNDDIFPAT